MYRSKPSGLCTEICFLHIQSDISLSADLDSAVYSVAILLGGARGATASQKISSPLGWPLSFLHEHKILNVEYIVYCKYSRIRKVCIE